MRICRLVPFQVHQQQQYDTLYLFKMFITFLLPVKLFKTNPSLKCLGGFSGPLVVQNIMSWPIELTFCFNNANRFSKKILITSELYILHYKYYIMKCFAAKIVSLCLIYVFEDKKQHSQIFFSLYFF